MTLPAPIATPGPARSRPATEPAVAARPTAPATVSPLRAVWDALAGGAPTVAAIRDRTGLDATVVDAAVDHLVRTGRVGASQLATCAGSCGSCPIAAGCGAEGTGRSVTDGRGSGPASGAGRPLLALWVRRQPGPAGGGTGGGDPTPEPVPGRPRTTVQTET